MIQKNFLPVYLFLLVFISCCGVSFGQHPVVNDSLSIKAGKVLFEQQCSACHNFKQDGIGPNLSGLTVSSDWMKRFIKNPKGLIDAGDKQARALFNKYHTVMPSFAALSETDLNHVILFVHTQKTNRAQTEKADAPALNNPIPKPISSAHLVVAIQPIVQLPPSGTSQPLTRLAKIDYPPHSGIMFILDQRGKLYNVFNNEPVVYLDMAQWKPAFINQPGLATGFGSFAFHPEFKKNGLFYTSHTEAAHSRKADFGYADSIKVTLQWVVCEWKATDPAANTFSGSCRELLRVDMVSGIHGMQEIAFNPLAKPGTEDYGLLYIGIGDGGAVENGYAFLAHRKDKIWGTIIRIDPLGRNSANQQYGIPGSNPFVTSDKPAVKEIYAYGFRNPNRITWSQSGQMMTTNIGQANIETLNFILKGHDYGWPIREGTFALHPAGNLNKVYSLPADDIKYGITYPVAQYDHDEGNAIAGGFEYSGKAVPQLKGKYLFGDIPRGRLFLVQLKDLKLGKQALIQEWQVSLNGKRTTMRELCGNDRVDLRLGQDPEGELYLSTKPDGKIYKIISAQQE